MDQANQRPAEKNEAQAYAIPWSITDTWLGVGLLVLLSMGMLVILLGVGRQYLQSAGVLVLELVYLLPILLIFGWRRISWKYLGFGKFSLNVMGMGCGLLLGAYLICLLDNSVL